MAQLSELLTTPVDEIEVPVIPIGTWLTRVISGKMTDEKPDKNGNLFTQAQLILKPVAPSEVGDVEETDLEAFEKANGFEETVLYFSKYCSSSRAADHKSMGNILRAAGASTKGRLLKDVLENGVTGLEFMAEVTHETWEGDVRARCDKIYAAE